ncbi:hypothetical protein MCUN1_003435 [Malassezia cuniculi]|uniref:pH-response regulator protein palC n=1 Tax=Malassezia cuniculi TaxID=948313 RepID=A0AAF0J7F3_9BASI|nr:hypothetical protein MCUN1_003435 [Malassezia cuniculi]
MYVYVLPTTSKVAFQDFVRTDRYASELSVATQMRASMRQWLKTQQASPDALRTIQVVSDYLPYLVGIYNALLTDDIVALGNAPFKWHSSLSRAPGNPSMQCPAAGFELAFTLLVYAMSLSNHASALINALGGYELDAMQGNDARTAGDEKLRVAADYLCRASGAFEYIATRISPQWMQQVHGSAVPDVQHETCLALAKIALADANTLAIRRLLAPALAHATDTLTPGPPLPPAHPSPSLLAKLEVYTADLYAEALALLRTLGRKRDAPESTGRRWQPVDRLRSAVDTLRTEAKSLAGDGLVTSSLITHLEQESQWHRALAFKWLGVDAGEAGGDTGRAVAFLEAAHSQMKDTLPRMFGGGPIGVRGGRAAAQWAQLAARPGGSLRAWRELELASVRRLADVYKRLNDTVSFQRIPAAGELALLVPGGRAALEPKAYAPPTPAFGPTTHVGDAADMLISGAPAREAYY